MQSLEGSHTCSYGRSNQTDAGCVTNRYYTLQQTREIPSLRNEDEGLTQLFASIVEDVENFDKGDVRSSCESIGSRI